MANGVLILVAGCVNSHLIIESAYLREKKARVERLMPTWKTTTYEKELFLFSRKYAEEEVY